MFFAPSKLRDRAKIWNTGLSQPSDHIKIKIEFQNPSQETYASSETPNQDLKDTDVLCTFKMKIEPKFRIWQYQRSVTIEIKIILENKKSEHWFIKDH